MLKNEEITILYPSKLLSLTFLQIYLNKREQVCRQNSSSSLDFCAFSMFDRSVLHGYANKRNGQELD